MDRRKKSEINAASMADVGFLLLVFFLVTTSFVKQKAISTVLPRYFDGKPGILADRNVLDVKINKFNELLVEGEESDISKLEQIICEFISNPNQVSDKPKRPADAVISLQNDEETDYETYIQVYSIIKNAYKTLRNQESKRRYALPFDQLCIRDKKSIIEVLPIKVSEAEPFISS
ncbi:MAG TPA: biopolymer transporter ExbD [Saprospiraceae bacterium]|nr:biopolymer transporter ExbD [Saprospiraceae bacterium]MCB9328080.1 biopolymer transporter ExbD [Lewinellaceae bacterium]HPK09516.1 biopolymer transporter ExbD [Saprospiraceae bacterium]HRX28321.1 biopolymer transporter ExbD [Saprospiraceae bacterium]